MIFIEMFYIEIDLFIIYYTYYLLVLLAKKKFNCQTSTERVRNCIFIIRKSILWYKKTTESNVRTYVQKVCNSKQILYFKRNMYVH